jgi:hypothetical protein
MTNGIGPAHASSGGSHHPRSQLPRSRPSTARTGDAAGSTRDDCLNLSIELRLWTGGTIWLKSRGAFWPKTGGTFLPKNPSGTFTSAS